MLKAVASLLTLSLICPFSLTNRTSSNFNVKQDDRCQYSQNSHSLELKNDLLIANTGKELNVDLTFDEENLDFRIISENDLKISISEKTTSNFSFSIVNTIGEGEYTFDIVNGSELDKLTTVYVHSDGIHDSASLSSMNDARSKHYLEYVCSNEDKILLGIEEQTDDFSSEETVHKAKSRFDVAIYDQGDIKTTQDITQIQDCHKLKVSGTVLWYDSTGMCHPAKDINVALIRDGLLLDSYLAKGRTDESGNFSFCMDYYFINNIYLGVFSETSTSKIKRFKFLSSEGLISMYSYFSPLIENLSGGHQINYLIEILPDNSDRAASFEITQAINITSSYVKNMDGDYLKEVDVYYPTTFYKNSYYTNILNFIGLTKDVYKEWDVICHEYGHYINKSYSFCDYSVGGKHYVGQDLIKDMGKVNGMKFAMSEGLATYLGIASHMYFSDECSVIPTANDMNYRGWCDYNLYKYSKDVDNRTYGEGSEDSIPSLLLKLMDDTQRENDNVSIGHLNMWTLLKKSTHWCISSLISDLLEQYQDSRNDIAKMLELEGYSPSLSSYSSIVLATGKDTKLCWNDGGSATNHMNLFAIIFEDEDNEQFTVEEITSNSYVLKQNDLNTILSMDGSILKWWVVGYNNDEEITGGYPSTYGSLKKDIKKTLSKSDSYNGNVLPGETNWFEFNAPFAATFKFSLNSQSDVKIEFFDSVHLDGDSENLISFSSGTNQSLSIVLMKNDKIYIRVSSLNANELSEYTLSTFYEHTHLYTEYVKCSKARHKFVCDCGVYVLQNHVAGSTYETIGSTKYTNCIKCGETISMNDTHVQLN